MNKIKVSIIAPVYKIQESILKESLRCMENQGFNNKEYEIILVDDGSPDNCGKICDDFANGKNNIKVIHTGNRGVSHARNIGIKNAKGKFICFVDPDDYIEDDMISSFVYLMENTNSDLIMCNYKSDSIISSTDDKVYIFENKEDLIQVRNAFLGSKAPKNLNITGSPWAKIYKKEVIEKYHCFFDEELPRSQDNEFNFRYFQYVSRCAFLNRPLYKYNIGITSAMRKYWPNAISNAEILLNKVYLDIQLTNDPSLHYSGFHSLTFGKIEDILYTYIVHPENKNSFFSKIDKLKKMLNEKYYHECLLNYSYDGDVVYRKLLVFTLKYRMIFGTYILAKTRIYLNKFRYK